MLAWFLLALALDRAQTMVALSNYGAPWNGIGAIESVLDRKAQAPMAYRVLVPWLVGLARRFNLRTLETYNALKVALITLALWSVHLAWGWEVAILTAVILPATFQYDYWDWSAEMFGINAAIAGILPLALAGALVHGLSRETAVLVPFAFFLSTGNIQQSLLILIVAIGTLLFVRLAQGKKELYCERWMVRRNLQTLGNWRTMRPAWAAGIFVSVLITAAGIVGATLTGWLALLPLALLASGWTMAVAEESRVFTSVIPWVSYAVIRLWL